MHGRTRIALAVMALTMSTHARAQSLSDEQVRNAIKSGENKYFKNLIVECSAGPGLGASIGGSMAGGVQSTGWFDVSFSTNEGRIAIMAANGKRLYKPVTVESIGDDLRQPAIVVSVEPRRPSSSKNGVAVSAPIEQVVLKSKAKSQSVVQPVKVDTEPVEYSNLLGGKLQSNRAIAFFDVNAVRELPLGDFDVVVVTEAGERRCKIDTQERAKILSRK